MAEIAKRCDSFVDSVEKLERFQKAWDRWVNGGKGRVYANMRAHDRVEARSECVPNDRQTASKSLDRRKVPFLRYDNIDRRPMVRRLNYYVARRTRCA